MKHPPDWHLVAEALSSLEFLRDLVEPENQSRTAGELIARHVEERNGIEPLSPGTLIAFAYMAIVYPKEVQIYGIPDWISMDGFRESSPSSKPKDLLRKLRNALSHGDFVVLEDKVAFGSGQWVAEITHEDLVLFLHDLYVEVAAQHYIGAAKSKKRDE